MYKISCCRCSK